MTPEELTKYENYIGTAYPDSPNTCNQYIRCAKNYTRLGLNLNQDDFNKFISGQGMFYKNISVNRAFLLSLKNCFKLNLEIIKPKTRPKKGLIKFMTIQEINHLIQNLPLHLATKVSLIFDTGLRRHELIRLTRKGIDLENKTIKGWGKGKKEFCLDFSDRTKNLLINYLKEVEGSTTIDPERPFTRLTVRNPEKQFYEELHKHAAQIGLHVTPHKLRHSLGHYLRSEQKMDLEMIREQLRHESINTTSIYATATRDETRAEMRKILNRDINQSEHDTRNNNH